MHRPHTPRVLGYNGSDGSKPVNTEMLEGLEIGLQPGSRGTIRTGDAQRDWRPLPHTRSSTRSPPACKPPFLLGSRKHPPDDAAVADAPKEWTGLSVTVDKVVHMPKLDSPPGTHPFAYFLSIHNESPVAVTIRGRKWVIRETKGPTIVVEGDGVVGQTPVIDPGGHFSYSSYHVITNPATAEGALFGDTADGDRIFTRIPPFRMTPPP